MDYTKVIEFVKEMTAKSGRPDNYSFRSRYEHIMRVYRWAIKLQAKEGGDLEIIALAALLHDVGWEKERPHEEVSAEIAVEYLVEQGLDETLIGRVGDIILRHPDKDTEEASYKQAYYRIKNYYRINQPKIRRCKTTTGRLEYTKRMKCIEEFINELERELF